MSKATNDKYYDLPYFQQRDFLILPVALMIKHLLEKQKTKTILEVGCGTGKLVKFLNQEGFKTTGCDKSAVACRLSGQIRASANALPFSASRFDAVLSISLIEHLTPKEGLKSISEAYRVLKPKGMLFIITPNFWSPNRFLQGKKWYAHADPTHITYYTPLSLMMMLKKYGFSRFRFWFDLTDDQRFECPFFNLAGKGLPKFITNFISYLFYSTPFALIRESFWISAIKT